ncbi:hypothetical protein [Vibrio cholerae]|uniref:hypothetical protein n=1 Tax=Vibrio cholerae TaxID=666 RepID=UPI003080D2E8
MFTATDVLNAAFIEQPLDKLWSLISPLYMVDESQWLAVYFEREKKTCQKVLVFCQ